MAEVTAKGCLARDIEEIGVRDYYAIQDIINLSILVELLGNYRLKEINCCMSPIPGTRWRILPAEREGSRSCSALR